MLTKIDGSGALEKTNMKYAKHATDVLREIMYMKRTCQSRVNQKSAFSPTFPKSV